MSVVMSVVGARPQFIKAGPVSRAITGLGFREILVHTGQHYDALMSDKIIADVGLREPDTNLGVGSGSHGVQTARMLEAIEAVVQEFSPDVVLTYGDTNSTLAGALAAAKLGVPTAHVEAGLRSFNRSMPEELNRVATDHLSDLLLAPTETAMRHLDAEGLTTRSRLTGDVMVDALHSLRFEDIATPAWASGDYLCATLHRPENTDDSDTLSQRLGALARVDLPVHLLAHPRLIERIARFELEPAGSVVIHPPLPYGEMLATLKASRGLLTDSGGLQKEAFILRVPCVTLRGETEWPETLEGEWNVLARAPDEPLQDLVNRTPSEINSSPFGNGDAASAIVSHIASLF